MLHTVHPKLLATLMNFVTTTSVQPKQLTPPSTVKGAGNTKWQLQEASWENEEHKAFSRYWR